MLGKPRSSTRDPSRTSTLREDSPTLLTSFYRRQWDIVSLAISLGHLQILHALRTSWTYLSFMHDNINFGQTYGKRKRSEFEGLLESFQGGLVA